MGRFFYLTDKFVRRSWRCAHGVARAAGGRRTAQLLLKANLLWLAPFVVLMSFFCTEILKDGNYAEIFPSELIFPTLMHAMTALLIAVAVLLVRRPASLGGKMVSVTLLGLLMVGYDGRLDSVIGLFRAVLPILPQPDTDIPVISLLFLTLLLMLTLVVGRLVERTYGRSEALNSHNVVLGTGIIIAVLAVGQFSRVAQILPSMIHQSASTAPDLPSGHTGNGGASAAAVHKPDIYYIVMDRYASEPVLRSQFDFDNSLFTDMLRGNGFTVRSDAYTNYPYTTMSISSALNAGYTGSVVKPHKDDAIQSRTLYHNLIRQSSVVKALKEQGYSYISIGSQYGATNKAPLADDDTMYDFELTDASGRKLKRLRGVEATQFIKSPYIRFARLNNLSWWPVKLQERDHISYVQEQLRRLNELASAPSSGGRLIIAHLLVPHPPFVFNADGSYSLHPGTDNNGLDVKDKYINQIRFMNSQMTSLVGKIQERSKGKAVVILNADEGPYPQEMNITWNRPYPVTVTADGKPVDQTDMSKWPADWLQMKYGILQAVRIPKATDEDMSKLSSVNIFRIVLDRYFGYTLPYLPDCHVGLNNGGEREYDYADITPLLEVNADPACKQYQSLPTRKLAQPRGNLRTE